MLEMLRKELDTYNIFNNSLSEIVTMLADSIPNNNINYRMKIAIATSELILFASQFRRNIRHWNGSAIPTNSITFSIAESGSGKDSSVTAVRKCFKPGYDQVEDTRLKLAKDIAIKKAMQEGLENPGDWETYKKYYMQPNPLFVAPSTSEGLIQHLNDLDYNGIGAGFIYSGEFGAELANSPSLIDNIKLLAEMYDEGSKEVKVLKSRENQSKEIKNLPFSALFVGSQDNILYDEITKRLFKREFSTKLARRSFFNFNPESVKPIEYPTVKSMFQAEMELEDKAFKARETIQEYIHSLTEYLLDNNKVGIDIVVDENVRILFLTYKRYNEEVAKTISSQFQISKLVRAHLQWKALKLAGALTILNGEDSITVETYAQAAYYCEMLDKDMVLFEQELVKEPYEIFVDFMHKTAEEGKASISLHTLRKIGYIPTSGNPTLKVKELIQLSTAYDDKGIYTFHDNNIIFEQLQISSVSGVSILEVAGTKEERQAQCSEGYEYHNIEFSDLADMLTEDYAYSPFKFKDGKRSKQNIESGCKWVCLDIDDSSITDEEAHYILQDINHHIARTSNADNPFKFRILLELDAIVDIPDIQWKHFIKSISDFIAIKADILPKSQIYFSYSGRAILSVTDKEPLSSKEHIIMATSTESKVQPKKLTKAQCTALIEDPLNTFNYAFEAKEGEGSRSLIRAAYHAKDLGMTTEEIIELMHEINDYWLYPIDENRLQNTIISQLERWG